MYRVICTLTPDCVPGDPCAKASCVLDADRQRKKGVAKGLVGAPWLARGKPPRGLSIPMRVAFEKTYALCI